MLHDGVNKLWILRCGGGLGLDGYKDELSAIDGLIRHALVSGGPDTKAKIEATVTDALKHMDDPWSDDTETCPRCGPVDCSPECIAAEQAEVDAYSGPEPKKFV